MKKAAPVQEVELEIEPQAGSEALTGSPNAETAVAQARMAGEDPAPQTSKTRTFYCWFGGSGKINGVEQSVRPSNMQIPCGGERRMDAANRVINAPFKMIEFVDGIFRTEDSELIAVLEKLMKNSPNITESQDEYLAKILPQEKAIERMQAKLEEQREEVNRLKEQLKRGQPVRAETAVGGKAVRGAINTGSVPRREAQR
jgi:hypothetical protein